MEKFDFKNLNEDEMQAITYLLQEFTKEKLMELVHEYETLEAECNKIELYLLMLKFFKNKKLLHKISIKRDTLGKSIQKCFDDIVAFESELAALLLLEIIDIETAKTLGYNYEYIKYLIEKYKIETERQYIGHYDGKNIIEKVGKIGQYLYYFFVNTPQIDRLGYLKREEKIGRYTK